MLSHLTLLYVFRQRRKASPSLNEVHGTGDRWSCWILHVEALCWRSSFSALPNLLSLRMPWQSVFVARKSIRGGLCKLDRGFVFVRMRDLLTWACKRVVMVKNKTDVWCLVFHNMTSCWVFIDRKANKRFSVDRPILYAHTNSNKICLIFFPAVAILCILSNIAQSTPVNTMT